jgi:competence protein ComGC
MIRKSFCFKASAIALALSLISLNPACGKKDASPQGEMANNPDLAELNKQVRRYSFEKRKVPQSVEELVSAGYIQSVPPAPAGKKFAIDLEQARVILVNQ